MRHEFVVDGKTDLRRQLLSFKTKNIRKHDCGLLIHISSMIRSKKTNYLDLN